ncbi:hypothetical protein Vretimale_16478, partial [Volvox reticuliferus]
AIIFLAACQLLHDLSLAQAGSSLNSDRLQPNGLLRCSENRTVLCIADPCWVTSCSAHPSARCLASYCSGGTTFQGQPVGPCEAVYVDLEGNRVNCSVLSPDKGGCGCPLNYDPVCGTDNTTYGNACLASCSNQEVAYQGECTSFFSCAPGSPRFMCTRQSPCNEAKCRIVQGAKCISMHCDSVYRGIKLPACSAIWYDFTTGDLFDPITCVDCPTYQPACGRFNRTYENFPNRCAASYLGVTNIKKDGKCQRCNGRECTTGMMKDLCILGVPNKTQCWSKKYQCQPIVGGPADGYLGRCLPFPNTTSTSSGRRFRTITKDSCVKFALVRVSSRMCAFRALGSAWAERAFNASR